MLIVTAIRWIMLISGILTATMVYAAIDPEGSMRARHSGKHCLPGHRRW
jgi:hypothetical protein